MVSIVFFFFFLCVGFSGMAHRLLALNRSSTSSVVWEDVRGDTDEYHFTRCCRADLNSVVIETKRAFIFVTGNPQVTSSLR